MELEPSWKKTAPAKEVLKPFIDLANDAAPSDVDQANIGQGRRILVVDDNLVVLKGFQFKLRAAGFEAIICADASGAMKLAREKQPQLMLLDINFPPDATSASMQWDGFIILQWLRRLEGMGEVPIIIISSSDAAKFKPKALAAGASDYFQKPINFPELLLRIQGLLDPAGRPLQHVA